ncbi:chitosanase [Pseudomonas sp. C2B4]|uniref:chitosanase n=1 Tax=Pseudomonas sp. C2B4 TaxID=2735270 RepID=UPI0015865209|nr:chitosanase [Pseudomonas sp. C2B4]NUU37744.1 peptidoglycan-binding protein [Pseudomonas sp. C2B4]
MFLTATQRNLIERVINTIETGKPDGVYGAISIYADGPNDIRQITYGRAQTTEYGNLRKLVKMYVAAGGAQSAALAPYADKVGSVALTDDDTFKNLLRTAGRNDPVMQSIQDQFFEKVYFSPAMQWADDNGFTTALSALVIYDSFIHSGQILWLLRQRFDESPPAMGGDEKIWISEYVSVRNKWLSQHHRPAVRKSVYRTKALLAQIAKDNWDLGIVPIEMNGTDVYPKL